MARLTGLLLWLTLVVLCGSASSQTASDTISFAMYLPGLPFTTNQELIDKTSQKYNEFNSQVSSTFSSVGGNQKDTIFTDGGGCVKVSIEWANGDQTALLDVHNRLQENGFLIWGQNWTVSFKGCAVATVVRTHIYVVDMPWSDRYKDHNSTEYQQLCQSVIDALAISKENFRTLEVQKISGCLDFYIEYDTANSSAILDQMSTLETNGIKGQDRNFTVQTKPCQESATVLRFKFYVSKLAWTENFRDHNSSEYAQLELSVRNTFHNLEGSFRTLEVNLSNSGCLEFYVEWNAQNPNTLPSVMTFAQAVGFNYNLQNYPLQETPCGTGSESATVLRFKFYVSKLAWTENFRDHNSSEYAQLELSVRNTFHNLEGSFRTLEVNLRNSGCLEFYVEWNAQNPNTLPPVMTLAQAVGFNYNLQNYPLQEMPCGTGSESATVLRFKFYVSKLAWSENFRDHNSSEYAQLELSVRNTFHNLEGSFRTLEVSLSSSGCLEFYVEWNAQNPNTLPSVMTLVQTIGFNYDLQNYPLQEAPCGTGSDEMWECPAPSVNGDMIGICLEECNDSDPGLSCQENYKCCSNGCGHRCERVGYRLKINATILTDMRWTDDMNTKDSTQFFKLQMAVKDMIKINFNTGKAQLVGDVELAKISPYSFENQNFSLLDIVLFLTNDVPNMQLEPGKNRLINSMFSADNGNVTVVDVGLGRNSASQMPMCGDVYCYGLCKELRSGQQKCSCNAGNMGTSCNTLVDLNSCPVVTKCYESKIEISCQNGTCENGELCCETPCGGHTCIEVGYFQKLQARIRSSFPYSAGLSDKNSQDFATVKLFIEGIMTEKIRERQIPGFKSFTVLEFLPDSNGQAARRKRQVNKTLMILELKFTEEIPVEDMFALREYFLNTGFTDGMRNQTIDDIRFGSEGDCANTPCATGSFCVTQFGGEIKCACPKSRSGEFCDVKNCSPGSTSLCQNGAVCSYSNLDMQMFCDCPVGFTGELCEVKLCDFIKAGACKTGTCLGDIEDWNICSCANGTGGLFCDLSVPDADMTTCERQNRLATYALSAIVNGTTFSDVFTVSASLFFQKVMTDNRLNVPKCYPRDGSNPGGFMSICQYNLVTGEKQNCFCTSENGTPNNMNYNFITGMCTDFLNVCDMGLCINEGICHNLPGGKHFCECPDGFSGTSCENAANHCPSGQPLMTTAGEMQCRRQPCPMGFICNADALDRWTACCLQRDFMCQMQPCTNGGQCVADIYTGNVCDCPQGRQGIFCEVASNDTVAPTACQRKQAFHTWVISILETGNPQQGITLENMRVILQHMGYEYFPTDLCDQQGNFKSLVQGVLVVNPTAKRMQVCMDKNGNNDPVCGTAVCEVLTHDGNMEFCKNGGKCIGDITQKVCDCNGTGFHGVRCELKGEENIETSCTLQKDIAYLAIGILNGSIDLRPGHGQESTQSAMKDILSVYNRDTIFVPYCDGNGQFDNRGCSYTVGDIFKKTCFCAQENGTKVGVEESSSQPPEKCDKESEPCPEDWGEDCQQPNWWCSDKVKCQPYMERCVYYTNCTNSSCPQPPEVACMPTNIKVPCDPQPCEDDPFSLCQPCGAHATCYNFGSVNIANMGYVCECNKGFSGPQCEINDNVCSAIPKDFCESRCIGDLSQGRLCDCEPGYAGMNCSKPARILCEKRKALFDDIISILTGQGNFWTKYSVTQLQEIVRSVTHLLGGGNIPVITCTPSGFYTPEQCMVSIDSPSEKQCFCVDRKFDTISSNAVKYIDYDICTAPTNSEDMASSVCSIPAIFGASEMPVCFNGGTCTFDIYAGKFCSCPSGYSGQFCQNIGNVIGGARSLCEFYVEAWSISHSIVAGTAEWITSDLQKQIYLNLTLPLLQLSTNESNALKFECHNNGSFKPFVCDYNIMTGERNACYCWNNRGLEIYGPPIGFEDSDKCPTMSDSHCPRMKCRYCEHGYNIDWNGCSTCDCKNPCEDMLCDVGHRCVVQKLTDCDQEGMTECTKAVCMARDKPGVCPGYSVNGRTNDILDEASNASSSCRVTCYDDSDCQGKQKCCGVCGNTCVDPEVTYSCLDYQTRMNAQWQIIIAAKNKLKAAVNLPPAFMRSLERNSDVSSMWIPSCDDDGTLFKPLQCRHVLNSSGLLAEVESCFCVDRLGNQIMGANANQSDPSSCDSKPYTCPFVEPRSQSEKSGNCSNDRDCVGNKKCCGNAYQRMCTSPVDTSKLATTLDKILTTVCERNSNICQGGSQCIGNWTADGVVCKCLSQRAGLFCENLISDSIEMPKSPCERKNFALKVFIGQLQSDDNSLSFKKLLDPNSDLENGFVTTVAYKCMADGAFEPKQCIVKMDRVAGWNTTTHCFCVDRDGMEILGTRTDMSKGDTLFCGGDHMICPRGFPYRGENGQIQECGTSNDCPFGYACRRSTYGSLYCCPSDEGLKDACKLPKDAGIACQSNDPAVSSSVHYYYDSVESTCKEFNHSGCEGNQNHFKTLIDCNDICKENIHPGACPVAAVKVTARTKCPDLCGKDGDCEEDYKCCASTCGKRCIPSDGISDPNMCPSGNAREAVGGGQCNGMKPCETGFTCITKGNSSACCPDYNNVNQCLVPPAAQKCKDFKERFFYNATSKMCQKFMYGGCKPDFNNFATLEDCCNACSSEGRCKNGMCPKIKSGSVGICISECTSDGDCEESGICCSNGCGTTCVMPEVEEMSDCMSEQLEIFRSKSLKKSSGNASDCDMMSMPVCEKDGTWAREQCHIPTGICRCVSPQGHYINNTMTRGVPQCQSVSEVMIMQADQSKIDISKLNYPVCNGGKDYNCCPSTLCTQRCWAYPDAICRINPCGGCTVEFYRADGSLVNCNEGLSLCEEELKQAATATLEQQINAAMASGKETDDLDNSGFRRSTAVSSRAVIINNAYPEKCKLPPETGLCKGFQRQWYFEPTSGQCSMFIWGMCGGNENRFSSPEECYDSCFPSSNPCLMMNCSEANTICKLQYDQDCFMSEICNITAVCASKEPQSSMLKGTFVPSCLAIGDYSYKQCHGIFCWCVNSSGQYVNGLSMAQSSLTCGPNGATTIVSADGICPNGQQPNINCLKACTGQMCPGQPTAQCVVDICSSNCTTKFVDMNGQEVSCTGDACNTFAFDKPEQCSVDLPCRGTTVTACLESVCSTALRQNCSKNPCAVCMVDPCTCQPYFVDATTQRRLTSAECTYLTLTTCQMKTCTVSSDNEKMKFIRSTPTSGSTSLPECDAKGVFKPKQCQGSQCKCVDQFGWTIQGNADGSCKPIDKIIKIKWTFIYNADFNAYKNKSEPLIESLKAKLKQVGLDPLIIKSISQPYQGSIKIDVTVEDKEDSYNKDLALLKNAMEQMANTEALNLAVDGQTIPLMNINTETTTASQLESGQKPDSTSQVPPEPDNVKPQRHQQDGLTETEKIIIGVVVGGVGLLIILLILVCICCRKKRQKKALDDSFEHTRENKDSVFHHSPGVILNSTYEEDENSVKVRL